MNTEPTTCSICGNTLDPGNTATVVGPDVNLVLGPNGVQDLQPTSVQRFCRIHLVPPWLFATFSGRSRQLAVESALASRQLARVDRRPTVRTKLVEGRESRVKGRREE